MKNTIKYTFLSALFLGFAACDVDNTLPEIKEEAEVENNIALNAGSADFSKYVAVGGSFTAGYTDGALFNAGQTNSFPNILASKFAMVGGGSFTQPLIDNNIGGYLINGEIQGEPRLYFDGEGPARLALAPTTEIEDIQAGPYNNMGVPGLKSFHLGVQGYGAYAALPNANPYFIRMASGPMTSILQDALMQQPTFFTLSEIGGNDVLDYALSGGTGVNQSPTVDNPTGNLDPSTYGRNDITNPLVFDNVYNGIVNALTANGAKGVVTSVPYITNLPHFTTVPYAPLDPSNKDFGPQIPTLNNVFGAINGAFEFLGVSERSIVFATDAASAVVIKDESLPYIGEEMAQVFLGSPTFPTFVASFGLPTDDTTLQKVAGLLGAYYGQARQATADDLLVLPSMNVIGEVNTTSVQFLMNQGLPQQLAGMFSVEGVSLPLEDKWVLTPEEQAEIQTATDAYNTTIEAVAAAKGLAFVDLKAILQEANTAGLEFDHYNMNASLVTGGLIGLDGVHLTARGYALMANKMLLAIDEAYGSNFEVAKDGLAKAVDYPTNYSPFLQ